MSKISYQLLLLILFSYLYQSYSICDCQYGDICLLCRVSNCNQQYVSGYFNFGNYYYDPFDNVQISKSGTMCKLKDEHKPICEQCRSTINSTDKKTCSNECRDCNILLTSGTYKDDSTGAFICTSKQTDEIDPFYLEDCKCINISINKYIDANKIPQIKNICDDYKDECDNQIKNDNI